MQAFARNREQRAPNDSKLSWNVPLAGEPPRRLTAVRGSCVKHLLAASPATRDHRRPQ